MASVSQDDSLLTLTGHADTVGSVAFSTAPDGRLLLASGSEQVVRVWDPLTRTSRRGPLVEFAHSDTVGSVAFGRAPDGQVLLATASEQGVQVWKALAGTALGDALTGHSRKLSSVALGTAANGQLIMATGSYDRTARLWDPLVDTAPPSWVSAGAISVAFSRGPGGRLLMATGSYDRTARLWDALSGMPNGHPLTGHVGGVSSVALGTAADGQLVLATCGKHGAQLGDALTGIPLTVPFSEPYTEYTTEVYSVAFGRAPDGWLLLATGDRRGARVWDAPAGTPLGYPGPTWAVGDPGGVRLVALAAAPDGRLLLATSGRAGVLLWDALGQDVVSPSIIRHAEAVSSMAFGTAPDGRVLLATGGYDRTVQLWDPDRTLSLLVVPRRSRVNAIAMAGPLLAIVDDEGVSVIEPAPRPAHSTRGPRPTGRRWRRGRRDRGQAAR